jgi:Spy/CpxP family protein refolding chaperone
MTEMSASRKAVFWVFGVFLLGLAIGGLGGYALTRHYAAAAAPGRTEADRRAHMLERMHAELNLTQAQQARVDEILKELQAKYRAIHEQTAPQTDAARQQARDAIRAMLTPEQKPKFEDFLRRLDEERKRSGRY